VNKYSPQFARLRLTQIQEQRDHHAEQIAALDREAGDIERYLVRKHA
jgi:hypothetical protein